MLHFYIIIYIHMLDPHATLG